MNKPSFVLFYFEKQNKRRFIQNTFYWHRTKEGLLTTSNAFFGGVGQKNRSLYWEEQRGIYPLPPLLMITVRVPGPPPPGMPPRNCSLISFMRSSTILRYSSRVTFLPLSGATRRPSSSFYISIDLAVMTTWPWFVSISRIMPGRPPNACGPEWTGIVGANQAVISRGRPIAESDRVADIQG